MVVRIQSSCNLQKFSLFSSASSSYSHPYLFATDLPTRLLVENSALGKLLYNFQITLGKLCNSFATTLNQFWDYFGTIW